MLTCIALMMMKPNPEHGNSKSLPEVYVTQNYDALSSSYCFGWFHWQFSVEL